MKPSTGLILGLALLDLACLIRAEVEPLDPAEEQKAHHRQPSPVPGALDRPVERVEPMGPSEPVAGSSGFVHGFVATLSVIIVSELGDKTFFIAAIMAMRHSRATVFVGAMLALAVMHVMSSLFGYATTVIPRVYTFYVSSFLFGVFGLKMLREGYKMSPAEAQEELEEVQEDLRKREVCEDDVETGVTRRPEGRVFRFVSKIFIQAFTMTFLAEWGDRSQLATIVLAAREDVVAVVVGGILGHAFCTGLAVLGGRMIAQRISVRTVTLAGGVVFILFALTALFMDPNGV
eukprot:snap_masked-scaffold18_size714446-processed-gene-6.0 protein:Tk08492 transcript:snap_masked-scaffold18_size714446-processed-gene-6.0-mRNA-1 annotation:"transmembrane protein 165"